MRKKNWGMMALIFIILVSCTIENVPEIALKRYIDYRLSANQEKNEMLAMVTGPLFESIKEKTDEEFAQMISGTKDQKLVRYNTLFKNCDEALLQCSITYTIAYDTYINGKKEFAVEVKKIAKLVRDQDIWKVADVRNIKTNIDNKNVITP